MPQDVALRFCLGRSRKGCGVSLAARHERAYAAAIKLTSEARNLRFRLQMTYGLFTVSKGAYQKTANSMLVADPGKIALVTLRHSSQIRHARVGETGGDSTKLCLIKTLQILGDRESHSFG